MNRLISVVIPTRERCETLRFTLATVVAQEFADLQILVSDNASEDDTREVVRGFEDPRIQYIRAPRRMSMCDHYDFALERTTGKYILIIGDDDAIMPGALEKLAAAINARPSLVYKWMPHGYVWPMLGRPAHLYFSRQPPALGEIELRPLVKSCMEWGGWGWGNMPQLYHAAIAREIPDAIRSGTGRVFHSMCPDVFSGFAIPAFSNTAVVVNTAVSCLGSSSKSNSGGAQIKDLSNLSRFVREYGDYKVHSKLEPALPPAAILKSDIFLVPDAALIAMDLFPEYYAGIRFDYSAMWAFLQRAANAETIAEVAGRTPSIKAAHEFSLLKFLFYRCGVHFTDQVKNMIARPIARRDLNRRIARVGNSDYPNISQAVNVLAQLETLA